jgi:hypothetical protein
VVSSGLLTRILLIFWSAEGLYGLARALPTRSKTRPRNVEFMVELRVIWSRIDLVLTDYFCAMLVLSALEQDVVAHFVYQGSICKRLCR